MVLAHPLAAALYEVEVVVRESGFVASYGDEHDDGASAWEATPRMAVTAVAAAMSWEVRQILAPGEFTVTVGWCDGADAMRLVVLGYRGHSMAPVFAQRRLYWTNWTSTLRVVR